MLIAIIFMLCSYGFFAWAGTRSWPLYWRGDPRAVDDEDSRDWVELNDSLSLGPGVWKGIQRSFCLVVTPLWLVGTGPGMIALAMPASSPVGHPLRVAVGTFLLVWFFFGVTITLWNRPRLLVPPALRSRRGMLRTWRDDRRRTPAERAQADQKAREKAERIERLRQQLDADE